MKRTELEILILIGVPASGKSLFAKEYVRHNDNYIRVSRDDFRLMLKNSQVCENKIEDMITSLVDVTIGNALAKKLNVLIDNTNLKQKYIKEIIEKFKYQANIDYRVFDISLAKAIERDEAREAKVGKEVIERMYKSYLALIDSFDFQPVKKTKQIPIKMVKSDLPEAVVFDIDGTLAHMGNRSPFDWDEVYKDELNEFVSEHIAFHFLKGRKILFVTGRDESCRKMTEEWFTMYGIDIYDHSMYMRPKDDFRKDTLIKREIYLNEIINNYNVVCWYDDRLSVVREINKLGIFTFTVNQGLTEF